MKHRLCPVPGKEETCTLFLPSGAGKARVPASGKGRINFSRNCWQLWRTGYHGYILAAQCAHGACRCIPVNGFHNDNVCSVKLFYQNDPVYVHSIRRETPLASRRTRQLFPFSPVWFFKTRSRWQGKNVAQASLCHDDDAVAGCTGCLWIPLALAGVQGLRERIRLGVPDTVAAGWPATEYAQRNSMRQHRRQWQGRGSVAKENGLIQLVIVGAISLRRRGQEVFLTRVFFREPKRVKKCRVQKVDREANRAPTAISTRWCCPR